MYHVADCSNISEILFDLAMFQEKAFRTNNSLIKCPVCPWEFSTEECKNILWFGFTTIPQTFEWHHTMNWLSKNCTSIVFFRPPFFLNVETIPIVSKFSRFFIFVYIFFLKKWAKSKNQNFFNLRNDVFLLVMFFFWGGGGGVEIKTFFFKYN